MKRSKVIHRRAEVPARRALSKTAILLAAVCSIALASAVAAPSFAQQIPLDPRTLTKYLDPLPDPAVLTPDTTTYPGVDYYEIAMTEFPQTLHTQLPPTVVWGYFGSYPGPTIEAQRSTPAKVKWINNLFSPILKFYLPVDQTLHWANPLGLPMDDPARFLPYTGPVPTVTHLHGAEVRSDSDGHPDDWFLPGQWNIYDYPNTQEATTLWYHDHALGITRLNVYGGLAAFYLLRDPANEPANLPAGDYEREIVIQDRMFDINGQLLFPSLGINPMVHPFWIPEFFGNTIVVNGKVWPYLNVEPRRYRFRLLNGSNARFYNLSFDKKIPFWQIGTDGGLLDMPVMISQLLIAPGERADVIVDFGGIPAGTNILLTNNARAPFPNGAPVDRRTTAQIMQIRVNLPLIGMDMSFNPAVVPTPTLRVTNPIERLTPIVPPTPSSPLRRLTLNEVMGMGGPLEVLLNNTKWDGTMSGFPPPGITETPKEGSTEVWEIINLTADTHPIHLHLVQFQLLSRQQFNFNRYWRAYDAAFAGGVFVPAAGPPLLYGTTGVDSILGGNPDITPYLQGKPVGPDPNETGWKDTVRMNPGEVTRIIVRFSPQDATATANPKYPFDPSIGPGYVWHCHILDHEDNEMMRPYTVTALP